MAKGNGINIPPDKRHGESLLLLHSMPSFEYLEKAVREGFLLKPHPVHFQNLEHEVDMLCFSEVVGWGRDLSKHMGQFGERGAVVRPEFVIRHGGDRVIYVDDNRELTRRLSRVLAATRAMTPVHKDISEDLFFALIDVLCFVEPACNQQQYEWRIARTSRLIDPSEKEYIIPFTLEEIEFFFVKDEHEKRSLCKTLRERYSVTATNQNHVLTLADLEMEGVPGLTVPEQDPGLKTKQI